MNLKKIINFLLYATIICILTNNEIVYAGKKYRQKLQRIKNTQTTVNTTPHNTYVVTQPEQPADNSINNESVAMINEIPSFNNELSTSLQKPIITMSSANNVLGTLNSVLPPELQLSAAQQPKNLVDVQTELNMQKNMLDETIEFNFEKADLSNLITEIEQIFNIKFITDDLIEGSSKKTTLLTGNKISFKTQKPLSKLAAWNLFMDFLSMAGFTIIPDSAPDRFKIKTADNARQAPLPTFFGVDTSLLPSNDQLIRYVYFVENSSIKAISDIVDSLRSPNPYSANLVLEEHKGFILTDKAYNIKMIINIVKELDRVSMPASMSIIKLKNADAQQVKELYDSLTKMDDAALKAFNRKQPTSIYLPENTRIIAEPRTNALILLGSREANQKIEEFITKHIDIEIGQPYSALHTHQLKYIDAETVADIMNNVCQLGSDTQAGKNGGVRNGDKYLKSLFFVAERETNRVIVRGRYDDFLIAQKIMSDMDEKQPQVAIDILLISVELDSKKQLGAQIRSKDQSGQNVLLGNNIKFQTSGLFQTSNVVQNNTGNGVNRLLGNLINLVNGTAPGNTIITLGQDLFGVWGIFAALQNTVNTQVIANPFLVATNQTPAKLIVGTTRRVQTGNIVGAQAIQTLGDYSANLTVNVTPLINSDGMISLTLDITIEQFTDPNNPASAEKTIQNIKTIVIAADKEVLALGGLIRTNVSKNTFRVPILGDIPGIGWFFKNTDRTEKKTDLLLLISPRLTGKSSGEEHFNEFTKEHLEHYQQSLLSMNTLSGARDPINKFFSSNTTNNEVNEFLFQRHKKQSTNNKEIITTTTELKENKTKNPSSSSNSNPPKTQTTSLPTTPVHMENNTKKRSSYKKRSSSLSQFFDDKQEGAA